MVGDMETGTAADFTIMVTYLPKTARKEEIQAFFEDKFNVTVEKITMAYNVEHLTHLLHEEEATENKLIHLKHHREDDPMMLQITKTVADLESIRQAIKETREKLQAEHDERFTGICFVSFKYMQNADIITDIYEVSDLSWYLRGCKYKLKYKGRFS